MKVTMVTKIRYPVTSRLQRKLTRELRYKISMHMRRKVEDSTYWNLWVKILERL